MYGEQLDMPEGFEDRVAGPGMGIPNKGRSRTSDQRVQVDWYVVRYWPSPSVLQQVTLLHVVKETLSTEQKHSAAVTTVIMHDARCGVCY